MAKKKLEKSLKKTSPSRPKKVTEYVPTDEELRNQLQKTIWGETFLTKFLDDAHKNTQISYLKLKGYFEMFDSLGKLFSDVQNLISWSDESDLPIALLLGRVCGNFFAAVRLSTSGQLSESYAQLRACLENALYAFNIYNGGPSMANAWLNRHKGKRNRRKSIELFRPTKILDKLISQDSKLGRKTKTAYGICIDFGAHPNERSVLPNLEVYQRGDRQKMRLHLLNTRDPFFRPCLLQCVNVAIYAIKIFDLICSEEFKQANVKEKLSHVENTFQRIAPGVLYNLRQPSD